MRRASTETSGWILALALGLAHGSVLAQPRASAGEATAAAGTSASAKQARVEPSPVRALGILSMHEGLALGLALDWHDIVIRVSGGYLPVFVRSVLALDDVSRRVIRRLDSGQLNADIVMMFAQPTRASRVGLSAGYRYNSVLGHGMGLTFQGEARLEPEASIGYTAGLFFFPWAEDGIDERVGPVWQVAGLQVHPRVLLGVGGSLLFDL